MVSVWFQREAMEPCYRNPTATNFAPADFEALLGRLTRKAAVNAMVNSIAAE